MKKINYKKLIVILGPTTSGKSDLAVKIALRLSSGQAKKKFGINGAEIISADSRQVYKGMNIGTGKITKKEMRGIPHHLLDVANPKRKFTVAEYRNLALRAIKQIFEKEKVPIICGGTGFYIQAVIDGIVIPEVKPDWELRKKLGKKSVKQLYKLLKKIDPKRAKIIDKFNPRRLIRAIEIVKKTKKSVPVLKTKPLPYPILIIGIKKEKKELDKLIEKRFLSWLKKGFIKEVKNLRKNGLSWKKIEDFGIHYRVVAQYLQGRLSYEKMTENSLNEIKNYSKRQMTWFTRQTFAPQKLGGLKNDRKIHWINNYKKAEKLIKKSGL